MAACEPLGERPGRVPCRAARLSVGQLLDQAVRLGHRAVAELGPRPLAGHVDVDGGQPERALQRALDPADALGLLQRHPGRRLR